MSSPHATISPEGRPPHRSLAFAWHLGWIAGAVFLSLALWYAWHLSRQQKPVQPEGRQAPLAGQTFEPPLGPPGGEEIRILAGSGRSFVDHADKMWSADEGFTGGTAVNSCLASGAPVVASGLVSVIPQACRT